MALQNEEYLVLVGMVVLYLVKHGGASLSDLRRHTGFRLGSRELSWVLKRLRKVGVVEYLGVNTRRWVWLIPDVFHLPVHLIEGEFC